MSNYILKALAQYEHETGNKGFAMGEAEFIYRHLSEMKEHGSSVSLSWDEDSNLWECSWISGGERYTGHAETMVGAVFNARGYGERGKARVRK